MDKLIFGIVGLVFLFAFALLLAYLNYFETKSKNSTTKIRRSGMGMNHNTDSPGKKVPGIQSDQEGFPTKKKQTTYYPGLFAFLLLLKPKYKNKNAHRRYLRKRWVFQNH
jgi:hypothetical protein